MSDRSYTLADLAQRMGGTVRGDPQTPIRGIGTIAEAGPGELTWVVDDRYFPKLADAQAAAVLGPSNLPATKMPAILVRDVLVGITDALACFEIPPHRPAPGIHPTAVVDPSAKIAPGACVGPGVIVGPRSTIGARAILHAHAYIGADCQIGDENEIWHNAFVGDRCKLGQRVKLWPGAVIGRDGFGFIFRDGKHRRVPQIGTVHLEDDTEIGANACVDRAKCGVTRIGAGTKIDNLVQVAHNVRTGPHCILVGQVGLSGSVRLGTGVVLGGQVGISDGLDVGDQTQVTAQSGVTRSLPARIVAEGKPARERMAALREQAAVKRLPALLEQIRDLSRRVRELEAAANDRKTR